MVSSLLTSILDSLSFQKVKTKFEVEKIFSFNYEISAVTVIKYVLEVLFQTNFPNVENVSVFT